MNNNINRFKKYLFLISLFFFFVSGAHIVYSYLYTNSIDSAMKGGTISWGVIGEFPNLNPLIDNTDFNKNIIDFLYRGLLKYDYERDKIVSDLAECNLEDLSRIECFLKNDAKWSDGSSISSRDVVQTFELFKETPTNKSLNKLLGNTEIIYDNNSIIFKNNSKDINFVRALFQPIVSRDIVKNSSEKDLAGNFNPMHGLYSGAYIVDGVSYDDETGIQKLILTKNTNYPKSGDIYVSKVIFRIFKDDAQLQKYKDTIDIFVDDVGSGITISKFTNHKFFLNRYNLLFINEDRIIDRDFRRHLLSYISTSDIVDELGENYFIEDSVFLNSDVDLKYDQSSNYDLKSMMSNLGYFSKQDLQEILIKEDQEKVNKDKVTNNELKYITTFKKEFSFTSRDDILVKGSIGDKTPDNIYVDTHKIEDYKKGDENFYFRISKEIGNLNPGANVFKIYFEDGGNAEQVEKFTLTYSSVRSKLRNIEKEFDKAYDAYMEKINNYSSKPIRDKVGALDDGYFYNKDLVKYVISLYYIEGRKDLFSAATSIKQDLDKLGVNIDITPISIGELDSMILDDKKDYDMLLLGADLRYFSSDIYPYVHSSQASKGYNFSNIRNIDLDILSEDLKTKVLSSEDTLKIENNINEILVYEASILPLYKKDYNIFINNNIKNFEIGDKIADTLGINQSLINSYVLNKQAIDFSKKGVRDFIDFSKSILTKNG